MKIFITGAAGYIGGMLADQLSKKDNVDIIICVDKEEQPEFLKKNGKVHWIHSDIAENKWQREVAELNPDVAIHCAWQIRELYGEKGREKQARWNIDGSQAVFEFAHAHITVSKLLYFSTISSYGAESENSTTHHFSEKSSFRDSEYLYAQEKKMVEENLEGYYRRATCAGTHTPSICVLRPSTITGPRGRNMFEKFTLVSALRGEKKNRSIPRWVKVLLQRMPTAGVWCRQFIHEDDVADIVSLLISSNGLQNISYNVYNISPSDIILASDMADITHKKLLRLPIILVRALFFFAWHMSHGRIPTAKGGWKFYVYPIVVDGTKICKEHGYNYAYTSREAIEKDAGRYINVI